MMPGLAFSRPFTTGILFENAISDNSKTPGRRCRCTEKVSQAGIADNLTSLLTVLQSFKS